MKTALLEDMKKRITSSDVEELIHTASFLDPRFKEYQLDDQKKATVLSSVHEACLLLELDGTVPADIGHGRSG